MAGPVIGDPIPDWLKPENASVFDGPMTKAIRAIASAIGANDPQSQIVGMMAPMQAGAVESPVGKALQAVANKIRAFHGSPHDFDRFATSKIGTGEGAQAYGHGLYFAENPETAVAYRDALSARDLTPRQRTMRATTDPALVESVSRMRSAGLDEDAMYAAMRREHPSASSLEIGNAISLPRGKMYEVAIQADPEHFLDWDKPLRQQGSAVREPIERVLGDVSPVRMHDGSYSVTKIGPDGIGKIIGGIREADGKSAVEAYRRSLGDLRGQQLYEEAGRSGLGNMSNAPRASETLKQAGIPGIKYLDQGSRAAGEGSRNFVVFDDALVSILKKYGVALGTIEGLRRKASANGGKLDQADVQAVMQ